MAQTFSFKFEELPLVIDRGYEDAGVTGEATISYCNEGGWGIDGIGIKVLLVNIVEARRPYDPHKLHWLDRGTPIFNIIHDRLETEWMSRVQEAVREQIAKDGDDAPSHLWDSRRRHWAAEATA